MPKKGDILIGKYRGWDGARHPIVYLAGDLTKDFIGIMLTSESAYPDNVPLLKEHFKENDSNGKKHKIQFNKSCFVKVQLTKRTAWGPFTKGGELTDDGIKYVESKISTAQPIYWEEYLRKSKVRKPKK
jgi:hypothetical protein